MTSTDTIFALSTPPARAGVAVVRLSGPNALKALEMLGVSPAPTPRMATLSSLTHPKTGSLIDQALVLYFQGPASFTGEDVAEFHIHGSIAVYRELLEVLSTIPELRHANPGEFTHRAFLNGKMDLTAAEGLGDLIAAETVQQKSQAQKVFSGHMAAFYESLRAKMVRTLAHLEAYIDFPDEEIPPEVLTQVTNQINELTESIQNCLRDEARTRRIRDGIHVVILGAPNSGKSSLMNLLAKRDVSIVSDEAGTTRDAIEVHLDIGGFAVILIDTAGIRESNNSIESEGIRRAKAKAESADLKIVLFDGTAEPDSESINLLDSQSMAIFTKSDLASNLPDVIQGHPAIAISTKSGEGVDIVLENVSREIVKLCGDGSTMAYITRERHRILLEEATKHLREIRLDQPIEIICEELRLASVAIGKITGRIDVDELLDEIFRSFCIGK